MKYFAIIEGEQCGPYTLEELPEAGVTPDTYVWRKGMDDWAQASEVADICRFFRNHLHDRMHPSPTLPTVADTDLDEDNQPPLPPRIAYYVQKHGLEVRQWPEPEPDYSIPPQSLVIPAILTLLFCCLPLGIVALYYALKARRLWRENKSKESYAATRSARIWIGVSICGGCFMTAIVGKYIGVF